MIGEIGEWGKWWRMGGIFLGGCGRIFSIFYDDFCNTFVTI